jgi:hypothetical protein
MCLSDQVIRYGIASHDYVIDDTHPICQLPSPTPRHPHPPKSRAGSIRALYTKTYTNNSTKSENPQLTETPISIHHKIQNGIRTHLTYPSPIIFLPHPHH